MAVELYTGWHGAGKTYNALADSLAVLVRDGVPIVTNATLVGCVDVGDWLHGDETPPPRVVRFETWDQLMRVLDVAIARHLRLRLVIDEAGKFLSSRFYNKLDPRVLMVLQERRKVGAGLDLIATAPHVDHVDKILRDVVQVVHVCRRFGGSEYSHDGGKPPRAFLVKTYRPTDVGKVKAKTLSRRLVPFRVELAALYTTGVVSMSEPMADETNRRPDLRGDVDRPAAPAVAINVARRA